MKMAGLFAKRGGGTPLRDKKYTQIQLRLMQRERLSLVKANSNFLRPPVSPPTAHWIRAQKLAAVTRERRKINSQMKERWKSVGCISYLDGKVNGSDASSLHPRRRSQRRVYSSSQIINGPARKSVRASVCVCEKSCINNCEWKTRRRLAFSSRGKIMILLERCSFFLEFTSFQQTNRVKFIHYWTRLPRYFSSYSIFLKKVGTCSSPFNGSSAWCLLTCLTKMQSSAQGICRGEDFHFCIRLYSKSSAYQMSLCNEQRWPKYARNEILRTRHATYS